MILRIINSLFNRQLHRLATMPFRDVRVRFGNDWILEVVRKASERETNKKVNSLSLSLHRGGSIAGTFVLPEVSADDFPYPLGLIEEWVPELDRVGPKLWSNIETGEVLGFEDVVERYGHGFPKDVRMETDMPGWFSEIQQGVSVRFVDVERLTNPLYEHDLRRLRRRRRPGKRTVNSYSSELGDRIRQTLAEYGSLSQSLDRTFPTRLVQQPHQSEFTMDQLRDELEEVESKRRKLIEAWSAAAGAQWAQRTCPPDREGGRVEARSVVDVCSGH